MQQEIHSYAFQLREECIVYPDLNQEHIDPDFFTSTVHVQSQSTYLYRLRYNETNARKSQLTSKMLKNLQVQSLYTNTPYNNQGIVINTRSSEKGALSLLKYEAFDQEEEELSPAMEEIYSTPQPIANVLTKKDNKNIFICTQNQIDLFDTESKKVVQEGIGLQKPEEGAQKEGKKITHCTIDPIHEYLTYCHEGNQITILDKTNSKQKYGFWAGSPSEPILNIDYNPNKQYQLMTAHYSCLKFWDVRKTNIPLRILGQDHHHSLLLKACYNHSHDELVLGCYDDGTVGLYRVMSLTSGSAGLTGDLQTQTEDSLVKLYDEHEDSVYKACWSQFSPWVFATVSYGAANLVINIVPSVQKYRILL